MGARGRDLQGTPGFRLAGHVRHVRTRARVSACGPCFFRVLGFKVQCKVLRIGTAVQRQPGERTVPPDFGAGNQGGFSEVGLGHHDVRKTGLHGRHNGRQDAPDRPEPAVQPQLGDEHRPAGGPDVVGSPQYGDGDSKVEAGSAFRQ